MEDHFPALNDFQIERELGQSEDSTYYHGIEKRTRRKVLLKLLNPIYNTEPGIVQSFIEEAKSIRAMNHPGVIQLFDFGQESGFFFTAFERPVVTLLDRLPQLSLSECIDLFQDIVKVLDYMHVQGYVHGHLTPGSIMFREDGTMAIMNLGTFILQSYQNAIFDEGKVSPAAYYKSPEQCRNLGVDALSDHYALGAILYHMLNKKPPYLADNTVGVIVSHVESPPPQLSKEFTRYQPLLDKMMAKDPFNRTQTGKEILEWLGTGTDASVSADSFELDFSPDFEPISSGTAQTDSPHASPYAQTSTPKNKFWMFLAPVAVIALAAVYFLFFKSSDSSNQIDQSMVRKSTKAGQKQQIIKEEPNETPEQRTIREIETAIIQGELSLAEAKINRLSEKTVTESELIRLRDLLKSKDQENRNQQYSAQLTIAEAALNSGDLPAAEKALSNARKILIGPELIRLESMLQQKSTAPVSGTLTTPKELLPDSAEDDRSFLRAKMSRSPERIAQYLREFPNGRHRTEAEALARNINIPAKTSKIDPVPQTDQKKIAVLSVSSKPTQISETILNQLLRNGNFFEIKRNGSGSFDNPLNLLNFGGAAMFLDPGLKLLWLAGKSGTSLSYDEALQWVKRLNEERVGGFSDWRIPTLAEAVSLLRPKTAGAPNYSVREFSVPSWIWSSDYKDENYHWAVFFNKGIVDVYRKTDRLNILAVKSYSSK